VVRGLNMAPLAAVITPLIIRSYSRSAQNDDWLPQGLIWKLHALLCRLQLISSLTEGVATASRDAGAIWIQEPNIEGRQRGQRIYKFNEAVVCGEPRRQVWQVWHDQQGPSLYESSSESTRKTKISWKPQVG